MQWFHFMAASVWMGGLLLAFLAVRVSRSEPPVGEAALTLAGYAVAVVLVTGVLRATDELGGFSKLLHLFSTSYLTTLDIKIAVVLLLIGSGAINRSARSRA